MKEVKPLPRYAWICLGVGVIGAASATAGLALGAWRKAELESQVRHSTWLDLVRHATRAKAIELAAGAREAASRAEASEIVGYARGGTFVGYEPGAAAAPEPQAGLEELRFFEVSRRGGESYEARGDPARAADAYSFFLPRIASPTLRARLRLSASYAAERSGDPILARALRQELFDSARGATTDSGLPIDLVCALELIDEGGAAADSLRRKIKARVDDEMVRIPTRLLARLADALGDESGSLGEAVEARRLLERAVEASPEVLTSRDVVVVESAIIVAKEEPTGERSLRAARWEWYRAPRHLDAWTYEHDWSSAPPGETEWGIPAEPICLGAGGPVLGHVSTIGGIGFEGSRRWAHDGGKVGRFGAVAQAAVILLFCVLLLLLLRRERQLARLRERLLANVSHELKTPVTSVRMFAELLGQPGLDPVEAHSFARHLRRESARLGQLLENLLDLSRPERAESRLAREPVDVRALIEEVADGFAFRAREAGVDFRMEGLEGGNGSDGLVLVTNGPAVERIVLNLLDNALKYRRADGSRVTLWFSNDERGVQIAVEDNGPGIPLRDRSRIFEEFYRGRFEDYGVKGAGLGLSIARRLARKLGGDVRLETQKGEGSTFSLVLPGTGPAPAASEAAA